jgi:hypothetical protein
VISEGKGGNKCGFRRVKEGGERKIGPITEDKSRLRHAPMGRRSKPEREEDLLSIKHKDQTKEQARHRRNKFSQIRKKLDIKQAITNKIDICNT